MKNMLDARLADAFRKAFGKIPGEVFTENGKESHLDFDLIELVTVKAGERNIARAIYADKDSALRCGFICEFTENGDGSITVIDVFSNQFGTEFGANVLEDLAKSDHPVAPYVRKVMMETEVEQLEARLLELHAELARLAE